MKWSWQWENEGHWDLHTLIFLFWRPPCSQTDLCAKMDEGHLGWVVWAESGRAVVSACPPAGTSVYSERHVCKYSALPMTCGHTDTQRHIDTNTTLFLLCFFFSPNFQTFRSLFPKKRKETHHCIIYQFRIRIHQIKFVNNKNVWGYAYSEIVTAGMLVQQGN